MNEAVILILLFAFLVFLANDGRVWVGRTIREAACTITKAFVHAVETWQQYRKGLDWERYMEENRARIVKEMMEETEKKLFGQQYTTKQAGESLKEFATQETEWRDHIMQRFMETK